MDPVFEQQVREHAYRLWLEHGMADGLAHDHWIAAERALLETSAPKPQEARVAAPRAKAAKAAPTAVKTVKAKTVRAKTAKAKAAPVNAKAAAKPAISTRAVKAKTSAGASAPAV